MTLFWPGFLLELLCVFEGAFRVLHFVEVVRDEFHAAVHEIANRRAHGLRAAREVVDLHEEVERLQVARRQTQRDLFLVSIPHLIAPPRTSNRPRLTDDGRTQWPQAI